MSDSEENTKDPNSQVPDEVEEVKENGDGDKSTEKLQDSSMEVTETHEEPKPGLLEGPVVLEGKRQRKKVERLSEKMSEIQEIELKNKPVVVPDGQGIPLGEIEYIQFHINRNKAEDLKLLHRILFGKNVPASDVKRNIRLFKGFDFTRDSKEHEKKMDIVTRVFVQPMKHMLEILGLERSGNKEELVKRFMEFVYKPVDLGKKVPQPKKKKKSKGKDKGKGKKRVKEPKKQQEEECVDSSNDEKSEVADEDISDMSDDEEKKPPPKKKPKVEKKSDTPAKKATPKKPKNKVKTEAVISSPSEDDSSSDDEPLIKKKKPPTDDELKEVVRKILDGADLEEITMKSVCKKVYDKYPEFDLLPRKAFIKNTVKEIIN